MTLPFHKYHGLGNDFIVIETLEDIQPALARALCDRHFGIGADGLLLLSPEPGLDARMIVINADGTRPEMCGNGLRCAAFHIASKIHSQPATVALRVRTDAGTKTCALPFEPDALSCDVTVDMGITLHHASTTVVLQGRQFTIHRADIGNPHAIVFETISTADFAVLGPALATHPAYPDGVNASFARVTGPAEVTVQVWERGVGPTLACGTAACAVAAVARRIHAVHTAGAVTVQLPGGQLTIDQTDSGSTLMTGRATFVFSGQISPEPDCASFRSLA